MEEAQFVGDVLDRHVVGDDVALEPRGERFAEARVGIDKSASAVGVKKTRRTVALSPW